MKENKKLERLFEDLQGSFDTRHPPSGHRERFESRLASPGGTGNPVAPVLRNWWKPLSIAASIVLLVSASVFLLQPETSLARQVAEISPEASQTSYYFAGLVEQQVKALQAEGNPQTQPLIDDALHQLQVLELDYKKLEEDLVQGGNSKLILSAMITNFQTRIDLLQDVMSEIEQIKNFKNNIDETTL